MSNENEIRLELERWHGYSAYEVAVRNGFVGTEAAWLESLKSNALAEITVNGKEVDENRNIAVHAGDILMQEGGLRTVPEAIETVAAAVEALAEDVLAIETEMQTHAILDRTATLTVAGWSSNTAGTTHWQTVTVEGVLASDSPFVDLVTTGYTAAGFEPVATVWGTIWKAETSAGGVTLYCNGDKPTMDIPIKIKVVR